ncbi:sulfotransferase family 2 domain-containing protein [Agaribacter flavus]|uniref:Sulfotransferase family 2 domain-containing protein n=1 Tax=Agaribacter flavus TaxID=1902781 RepID=A0ABV7FTT7_9ALTE
MIRYFRYSSANNNPLANNPRHKLANSHALNIYLADAIYSFIPKNACSTMRTSIALANGCIKDPSQFNWIHKNNFTFSANLSELLKAKYTFTILRCPYSRLASAYLDKIVNRDNVAWGYYELRGRKVDLEDVSFSSFVKSMAEPRIRAGNPHWRPQVDFLVYENYDDIFAMENFSQVASTLKNKINLEVVDARKLTNHGVDSLTLIGDKNYSDTKPLEFLKMKAKGKYPTAKALYSPELVKVVNSAFKADLDLYKRMFGTDNLLFK